MPEYLPPRLSRELLLLHIGESEKGMKTNMKNILILHQRLIGYRFRKQILKRCCGQLLMGGLILICFPNT
jgi:hypothetical protein